MMKLFSQGEWCKVLMGLCALLFVATSCQRKDYVAAIPSTSTALVRLDPAKMDKGAAGKLMADVLGVDDMANSGIDAGNPLYLFETIDGNLGLCAKVNDADDVEAWLGTMAKKGKCGALQKAGDKRFADVGGAWCLGLTDKALVVLGPVATAALPDARRKVARMLSQDEERSILEKPIFERLDTMQGAVGMVARASALPGKFVAPITIGAPKDVDASKLMVAATISMRSRYVVVEGETFSFDRSIDDALRTSNKVYRTIGADYARRLAKGDAFAMLLNVRGEDFLPLAHNSKALEAMLAGLNTAIDFDNILRSVDGPMLIASRGMMGESLSLSMRARIVANPQWVADVDYWKASTQKGASISDMGRGAWKYVSGSTKFGFGIRDGEFFGSTSEADWTPQTSSGTPLLAGDILTRVATSRLALVIDMTGLRQMIGSPDDGAPGQDGLLSSLLTMANGIVYVMK